MKYTREEGKIYFAVGGGYNYLFRANSTGGYSHYIVSNKGDKEHNFIQSNSDPSFYWDVNFEVRNSTESEQQWFELCLKNNKLMPKPEFKENNYEIY